MGAEVFTGSIFVEASPEEVFAFFTDAEALVSWMGDEATVEPRTGGRFILRFDDRRVEGRYVAIEFPHRIVITWGRHGSVRLPAGSSTLEVRLVSEGTGTRVTVVHDGLPDPERDLHARGWTFYLGRLSSVVTGGDVAPHHVPADLVESAD